jgi:hypothetical protein
MITLMEATIQAGVPPIALTSGSSGCYLFRDCLRRGLAIVKPTDKSAYAPNNPKGLLPTELRASRKFHPIPEVTTVMEVAAFLLDHDSLAKVLITSLVKARHPVFHYSTRLKNLHPTYKAASIEKYVQHICTADAFGPSRYSVQSVHRLGILDVRLYNMDMHSLNILVCFPAAEAEDNDLMDLVPIDHGDCLPNASFPVDNEWVYWSQSSVPFSDDVLRYIHNLDLVTDANLLRKELPNMIKKGNIRLLVISTTFLKLAAASGLTLCEIGQMMHVTLLGKGEGEEPNVPEKLCLKAKSKAIDGSPMTSRSKHAQVILIDVVSIKSLYL